MFLWLAVALLIIIDFQTSLIHTPTQIDSAPEPTKSTPEVVTAGRRRNTQRTAPRTTRNTTLRTENNSGVWVLSAIVFGLGLTIAWNM
jgi:hypothetical protein